MQPDAAVGVIVVVVASSLIVFSRPLAQMSHASLERHTRGRWAPSVGRSRLGWVLAGMGGALYGAYIAARSLGLTADVFR